MTRHFLCDALMLHERPSKPPPRCDWEAIRSGFKGDSEGGGGEEHDSKNVWQTLHIARIIRIIHSCQVLVSELSFSAYLQ